MREEQFIKHIDHLDTDASMDHRITDQLLNYTSDNKLFKKKLYPAGLVKFYNSSSILVTLTRISAVFILFFFFGTATVMATDYFIKTYKAEFKHVSLPKDMPLPDRKVIQYGTGHINIKSTTCDKDGNIIATSIPSDPYNEDVKAGDDAFAVLELPNLTPTYLYENYLLEYGGYKYSETTMDDGTISKMISAGFISIDSGKYVFFEFLPSKNSTKNPENKLADNHTSSDDYEASNYTNLGGLECNLIENESNFNTTASIFFDSYTLGNGILMISCTNMKSEEVRAILDSIPITASNPGE